MSKKNKYSGKTTDLAPIAASATVASAEDLILHTYTENSYLEYAMSVVRDRALAQIQDGQKPVQKRILYSMRDLRFDVKPVKSVRVVGDVLAKLHPHGDSSVYDAMVRMAQDFTLRNPLINGQGNFGSQDGDTAAAYRYTECTLSAFSDLLLSEVNRGTVDFKPNFDNTFNEPTLLPARLPILLLNGAKGIAVGMACEIPPHNLDEVGAAAKLLVDDPKTSDAQVLKLISGPDLPGGGQIISSREDILNVYASGSGLLRMRAKYEVEELARNQWQIIISELPYQVAPKKILEQIESICNPQPAKGKSVTQSQLYLKQAALALIEKATDESDKDAAVRLVVSPVSSKQSPEELMAFLFANTELECSLPINLTFIGLDGNPQTRGIAEMLRQWCTFRVSTVKRRITFDLNKLRARIHILEGRNIVFLNVDKVIKTIREADDPKADLIAKFKLSDIQADDILEMRLRQLAHLEGIKIDAELKSTRAEAEELERQLSTDKTLRRQVSKELVADIAKYSTPRRTLIKEQARAESQTQVAKSVVDEPLTIMVSKNLWVRARTGHDIDPATITWKTGDSRLAVIETRTTQPIVFIDSKGRAYSVDATSLPTGRGDGAPLSTLIELQDGAKLLYVLSAPEAQEYIFSGTEGYGFRAPLKALLARPRAGKAFLTLQEGELPLPPAVVDAKSGVVACGSNTGKLLLFPLDEVKSLDKGKGVKLLELSDGEKMQALYVGEGEPLEVPITGGRSPNLTIKGDDWRKFMMHRARKGCQLPKKAVIA